MNLYIDPGTGSMLFTVAIGILGALVYAFRNVLIKAKISIFGGRKARELANDKNRYPIVIFTDSKRYWNLFRPICDELEKRKQDTLYLTAEEDDPALDTNYEYIHTEFAGKGNRTYARMNMLHADVVLSSTPGLDVYQWKRSRYVKYYVHIPHGIYDLTKYRIFGIDYYDAILMTGRFQEEDVRKLENIRHLPAKELTIVGMPYLDEMLERYRRESTESENGESDVKTVLLAPSWGESAILSRYGERIFDALLKTDYHIIVRPHPQSFISEKELIERLMKKYPDSNRLEWDHNDDNYNSLKKSDLLISDFSGVVLDYAFIFEKPVIYAKNVFDPGPYDAYWIDRPMWLLRVTEKIGNELTEENVDNIGEIIRESLHSEDLKTRREKAKEESWSHIGDSSTLIVDYLSRKQKQLNEEKEQRDGR